MCISIYVLLSHTLLYEGADISYKNPVCTDRNSFLQSQGKGLFTIDFYYASLTDKQTVFTVEL